MEITFNWEKEPSDERRKNDAEESIRFGLNHHADPRKLKPQKMAVFVKPTFMDLVAEGVGYNEEGKAIFASKYSWSTGRGGCWYFDDPKKGEL